MIIWNNETNKSEYKNINSKPLSVIFGLLFCLIFSCILHLIIRPQVSGSFSKHIARLFTDSKLFLNPNWGSLLDCFLRLLLEFFIFKHFIHTLVCRFAHFMIVFLLYCEVLGLRLLGLWGENGLPCGCLWSWDLLLWLLPLLWLLLLLFFRLGWTSTESKQLSKYVLLLLGYWWFLYIFFWWLLDWIF